MKKSIFNIATMRYFAANTGADSGAPAEVKEKQPELKEVEKQEGSGEAPKGTVGEKPVPQAKKDADKADEAFTIELAEKAKNAPKLEGEELKTFIEEESKTFKEIGDSMKGNAEASAERWARFANLVEMKTTVSGNIDIMQFCEDVWNLLLPEVKLQVEGSPNKFYKWSTAEKYGNSAAKTIGAMRLWLKRHADRLYPELVAAKGPEVVGQDLTAYRKAKNALDTLHKLTFLPTTKYVELNEDGTIKEGVKAVTLDEMLMAFYKSEVETHLEKPKGAKEKIDEATIDQIADELDAEELEKQIKAMQEKLAAKKAA